MPKTGRLAVINIAGPEATLEGVKEGFMQGNLESDNWPSISPEWSMVGYGFRNLLETAASLGSDRHQLMAAVGLDQSLYDQLDRHYPLVKLLRLFKRVAEDCSEPDIGLQYLLHSHPLGLGLLSILAYSAPTLREAWETVIRYRQLVMNLGRSRIFDEGDCVSLHWYPYSRAIVMERYFVDAVAGGWVLSSRAVTGQLIKPVSMTLTYDKPKSLSPLFHDVYGTNIKFNHPFNSIHFRQSDFELPLLYSNKAVYDSLAVRAKQEVAQFKAECTLAEKLEYQLIKQLGTGDVSMERMASKLHISPRTLQRRLKEENTTFNELLINVRHEQALQLLQQSQLTTLEIAMRLGYGQASSFSTAFKSWTKQTPSEYRRSLGMEEPEV